MGKSVSFSRPSYDGKYLMFTMSDYGNFSIWHKEADLWLVDLNTGISRSLTEVNSNDVESYHNWSSNSRWFVFSSRRIDGLIPVLLLQLMIRMERLKAISFTTKGSGRIYTQFFIHIIFRNL